MLQRAVNTITKCLIFPLLEIKAEYPVAGTITETEKETEDTVEDQPNKETTDNKTYLNQSYKVKMFQVNVFQVSFYLRFERSSWIELKKI